MMHDILSLNTNIEITLKLAKKIKELRVKKQLRQEDVALKSGIPLGTYRKFERTGQVSLEGFIALARLMGKLNKIDSFLEDEPTNPYDIPRIKAVVRVRKKR